MALEKGIAEFITTDFFSEAARTALRDVRLEIRYVNPDPDKIVFNLKISQACLTVFSG